MRSKKCNGFYFGGCQFVKIEHCKLTSIINGIFSSGGSNIQALYNYVEDSQKYGIFLYNGPDHEIAFNYVAWTGREGIGTNGGNSYHHNYHDNVIHHCGWTAINLEINFRKNYSIKDQSKVTNNLVAYTHYGIILMGTELICSDNKVFYSSQDGIMCLGKSTDAGIENNLICGSSSAGINIISGQKYIVEKNRIYLSNTGIKCNISGLQVINNDFSQFFWAVQAEKGNALIENNTISQGRNGVFLKGNANIVKNNSFQHLIISAIMRNGSATDFLNNKFTYVGDIVRFVRCKKCVFKGNKSQGINYGGLFLRNCEDCSVEKNTFENITAQTIQIIGGNSNIIKENVVKNFMGAFGYGAVEFTDTSHNNIDNNSFDNCALVYRFKGQKNEGNICQKNTYHNSRRVPDNHIPSDILKTNKFDFKFNLSSITPAEIASTEYTEALKNWEALRQVKGKVIKDNFISTLPGQSKDNKAIKVELKNIMEGARPWASGAVLKLPAHVPAGQKVILSFRARSFSGSPELYIVRLYGGNDRKVLVLPTQEWKEYSFPMLLSSSFKTGHIIFSLVKSKNQNETAEGEFAIDKVSVSLIGTKKQSIGSNKK